MEPFAGRQGYTFFDLFWGFDTRKVDPQSQDMTVFLMPPGLLQITDYKPPNGPRTIQALHSLSMQAATVNGGKNSLIPSRVAGSDNYQWASLDCSICVVRFSLVKKQLGCAMR